MCLVIVYFVLFVLFGSPNSQNVLVFEQVEVTKI